MKRALFGATVLASTAIAAQVQNFGKDWDGWYIVGQVGLTRHQATYENPDYDWFGHT